MRLGWWAIVGCGVACAAAPDAPVVRTDPGPRWVAPLVATPVAPGTVGGVRWLSATADRPTRMVVHHDDGEQVRTTTVPERAVAHRVAFVGFPPGPHTVWVELVDAEGTALVSEPLAFVEPALEGVRVDVLAHDPERAGEGWLLGPLKAVGDDAPTWVVMLDEANRLVWWADPEDRLSEVQLVDGQLEGIGAGGRLVVDLTGRTVEHVVPELGAAHHDLVPLPDGTFWTLVERPAFVAAYPVDYDALDTFAPAVLRDSFVVHVGADGRTLAKVALADLLDTTKIGWNALDWVPKDGWFDWNHANGLAIDPLDGGPVVTLRHLDAVVKLTPTLELDWILGTPEGWGKPWADALLEPVGELVWPLHPHAPEVLPDGTLVVFDNHNDGYTPYGERPDAQPTSRAVGYRVEGRTVRQVWSYDATATGPLFSGAVGDVDVDAEGRVLVDYGFVHHEGGIDNVDAGRGDRAVRWVEGWPGSPPVLDLRLSTDPAVRPEGVHSYRVQRVPSAYGPVPRHTLAPEAP